jgi:hypothetical protein
METSLPTFLNSYKLVQSSIQLQLEIESLNSPTYTWRLRQKRVGEEEEGMKKSSVCSFWMSCKYESIDAFFHFHFGAMLKSVVCVSHTYTNTCFLDIHTEEKIFFFLCWRRRKSRGNFLPKTGNAQLHMSTDSHSDFVFFSKFTAEGISMTRVRNCWEFSLACDEFNCLFFIPTETANCMIVWQALKDDIYANFHFRHSLATILIHICREMNLFLFIRTFGLQKKCI